MFKIAEDKAPEKCVVIIQCDSGHLNGDLIACARYRIYDLRTKADEMQMTHVLFIIHLPQQVASSSFVGFQGDPWISSHIDDLRPTSENAVSANLAIGLTISELFLGRPKVKTTPLAESIKEGMTNNEDMEDQNIEGKRDNRDHSEEMPSLSDDNESIESRESWQDEGPSLSQDEKDTARIWEQPEHEEETEEHWAERVEHESMESEELVLPQATELTVDDIETEDHHVSSTKSSHELELLDMSVELGAATSSQGLSIQIVEPHHEIELPPSMSPLFRRLHGCIQAAASRLKDSVTKRSTKRVEILVHLIHKDPPDVPG